MLLYQEYKDKIERQRGITVLSKVMLCNNFLKPYIIVLNNGVAGVLSAENCNR